MCWRNRSKEVWEILDASGWTELEWKDKAKFDENRRNS